MEKAFNGVNVKLNKVIDVTNDQTDLLKCMAYKSIDLEARSRRNNLIFRGFSENTGENCFSIIRDFLEDRLDIDPSRVYIARAHRLGKKDNMSINQKRPLIANFRDFCDVEMIMSRAFMLKDTPLSIDFDYPKEIKDARGRLWPKYKELKRENPRSKVQIVYPAKLIKDGRMILDGLPEWGKYIGKNRLKHIETIHKQSELPNMHFDTHENMNQIENMETHLPFAVHKSPNSNAELVNTQTSNTEGYTQYEHNDTPSLTSTGQFVVESVDILNNNDELVSLSQRFNSKESVENEYPSTSTTIHVDSGNPHTVVSEQTNTNTSDSSPIQTNNAEKVLNESTISQNTDTLNHIQTQQTVEPQKGTQLRGRPRESRAIQRSERRSNSATPYGRKNTRGHDRGFPKSKNRSMHETISVDRGISAMNGESRGGGDQD